MELSTSEPNIKSAKNIAKKILSETGLKTPPILLGKIVAHLKPTYGLEVYAVEDFGEALSGIRVTEGEMSTIGYNQKHSIHRKRFTVAHEIGHVVMGHPNITTFTNLKSTDPCETEANQFAAELLMPFLMLKNDIKNGIRTPQLLADRYNVSEEAMWWRVLECKLLSKL